MAYNYEGAKKAYQSMTREQQQQFVENNKNDANFQRFAKEYAAEMAGKSTPASIPTTVSSSSAKTDTTTTPKVSAASSAKTYTAVPEYQGTGSNKINTYQNQGAGNYSYDTGTQYYEKQGTPVNTNYSSTRNAWDALSYEQQQEKLNQNPNLREGIIRIGGTIKEGPTGAKTSPYQNQGEGQYVYNPKTGYYEKKGGTQGATQGWDYQDNSQARMDEIANNLNNYRITNPNLFDNWGSFYNFFIAGKGRTPEQEKFLTDYYNNMKRYNEYDNLSYDEVGGMIARGEIPDDYLNYLKNSDPQRWAEIQGARKNTEDQIMNETYLDTAASQAGFDMGDSDWWKWNKTEMGYRDVNNDGLDDRLYHAPTEEELKLVEENNQYEQERAKLTDAMKWLQEDLTNQYPDADLSTIMILTSDRGNKIQRALDTLAVNQTKVQGSLKYLQNERATMDDAGQNTINELQKQYGMYYDYSPEGISKLAQAKYAATNVTLDQADNGTDAQKQMALQNVLDGYYEKYGAIIQRSEAQVINDVMALAKQKGISLSQALEENFLKYLRQKPGFEELSTVSAKNPEIVKIGDNAYAYWDNGKLIEIGGGTATGTHTFTNYTPITEEELSYGLQNFLSQHPEKTTGGECGSFVNDYLQSLGYDRLYTDPIDKKAAITNTDTPAIGSIAVMDSKKYPENGHTAIVIGMDGDRLQILESNWNDDKKVHTRWINKSDVAHGYFNPSLSTSSGGGELRNPDLEEVFREYSKVGDDRMSKKDFWAQWTKTINNAGLSEQDFLKQYDEYYAMKSSDAFLDILSNLDHLIELTGKEFDLGDRMGAKTGFGDVGNIFDYIKNNLTLDALIEAKNRGAKLGVLSDSDVRMVAAAASVLDWDDSQQTWNNALNKFRESILNKNKYLKEKYKYQSAYSPNVGFKYNIDDNSYTFGTRKNNNETQGTTQGATTKTKTIKNLGK